MTSPYYGLIHPALELVDVALASGDLSGYPDIAKSSAAFRAPSSSCPYLLSALLLMLPAGPALQTGTGRDASVYTSSK